MLLANDCGGSLQTSSIISRSQKSERVTKIFKLRQIMSFVNMY
jgi:hypothetical protein